MDFATFSKIATRFVEPGDVLAGLLALGVVLQWFGLRIGLWLASAAAASFLCVIFLPIDQWLARPLENRFPRVREPAHIDGILVLSAGQQSAISASRGIPVQHFGGGDMIAAAELMRRHPEARLVFTGGSAFGGAAADVARKIFEQLGVDQSRATYEAQARDTWENLLFAQKLARPKPAETWLLVASALHMPRAMGVAQRLDWQIAPWPTDFLTPGGNGPATSRRSLGRNILTIDAAAHEWLGLLVYRIAGKTVALFPAP
jgi:uncharacterized SAM-binding protein YcdF (DUF218 family)